MIRRPRYLQKVTGIQTDSGVQTDRTVEENRIYKALLSPAVYPVRCDIIGIRLNFLLVPEASTPDREGPGATLNSIQSPLAREFCLLSLEQARAKANRCQISSRALRNNSLMIRVPATLAQRHDGLFKWLS